MLNFMIACQILSNSSGLVVPKLTTKLVYERIQDIIYNTHLPTIVAQNNLINVSASNDLVIWRNTASELLNVI